MTDREIQVLYDTLTDIRDEIRRVETKLGEHINASTFYELHTQVVELQATVSNSHELLELRFDNVVTTKKLMAFLGATVLGMFPIMAAVFTVIDRLGG